MGRWLIASLFCVAAVYCVLSLESELPETTLESVPHFDVGSSDAEDAANMLTLAVPKGAKKGCVDKVKAKKGKLATALRKQDAKYKAAYKSLLQSSASSHAQYTATKNALHKNVVKAARVCKKKFATKLQKSDKASVPPTRSSSPSLS